MKATKPEIAVASAARGRTSGSGKRGNGYGHLAKEVFDRVRPCTSLVSTHPVVFCDGKYNCSESNEDRAVYSTASTGALVVRSGGSGWEVSVDGTNFESPSNANTSQCGT